MRLFSCLAASAAAAAHHASKPRARSRTCVPTAPGSSQPQHVARQPHGVDADHRSSSRIHAAHSLAALAGQVTVIFVAPRCSSMGMAATGVAVAGGGRLTGTNNGRVVDASMSRAAGLSSAMPGYLSSASRTQRRSRLAWMPCVIATAAIDMPGYMQVATASALNSSLCRRRRRRRVAC